MINLSELIEVKLKDPEDFLKIRETLTRIGIASKLSKTLWQSCHILHKQGRYFLVHFKEMFLMDGKTDDFSDADKARRNTIANLLHDWELYDLVDESKSETPVAPMSEIKVIAHKEKSDWELVAKYTIGSRLKKS